MAGRRAARIGLALLFTVWLAGCASQGQGGNAAMAEANRAGRLGDVESRDPTFPHEGYAIDPPWRYRQRSDVFDGPGGFGVGR